MTSSRKQEETRPFRRTTAVACDTKETGLLAPYPSLLDHKKHAYGKEETEPTNLGCTTTALSLPSHSLLLFHDLLQFSLEEHVSENESGIDRLEYLILREESLSFGGDVLEEGKKEREGGTVVSGELELPSFLPSCPFVFLSNQTMPRRKGEAHLPELISKSLT